MYGDYPSASSTVCREHKAVNQTHLSPNSKLRISFVGAMLGSLLYDYPRANWTGMGFRTLFEC